MKSFKRIVNELPVDESCHLLSDDELHKLQRTMLTAYKDVEAACDKNGISVTMTSGNVIGAIRHKGFIPWDDDVDLMMSRKDFEIFKQIFDKELGGRYVLNSPNLSEKPISRFPKILIKGTRFVEIGMEDDERACIKMDLFIIENIPENLLLRRIKGTWCNFLMAAGAMVSTYEQRSPEKERRMSKTEDGRKVYKTRVHIGRLLSFISSYRWYDLADRYCQYHGQSNLVATPCGAYHYFGTIMERKHIFPFRKVAFEDTTVYIPNDYDYYLRKLYGNYMEIPPKEKQEHHYVRKIGFQNENNPEA